MSFQAGTFYISSYTQFGVSIWKKLADVTASSAGSSLDSGTFESESFMQVLYYGRPRTAGSSSREIGMRVNGVSGGANYEWTYFMGDATTATSAADNKIHSSADVTFNADSSFNTTFYINNPVTDTAYLFGNTYVPKEGKTSSFVGELSAAPQDITSVQIFGDITVDSRLIILGLTRV